MIIFFYQGLNKKQYTKNRILKFKKEPFTKTTWYGLLVNYILESIKNTMGRVKGKNKNLFKTNTKDKQLL